MVNLRENNILFFTLFYVIFISQCLNLNTLDRILGRGCFNCINNNLMLGFMYLWIM